MPDLLIRLGDRIRKLRKKHGLTQVEFAERVGLDRSFLADVECGKRNISILNLEIIAKRIQPFVVAVSFEAVISR